MKEPIHERRVAERISAAKEAKRAAERAEKVFWQMIILLTVLTVLAAVQITINFFGGME